MITLHVDVLVPWVDINRCVTVEVDGRIVLVLTEHIPDRRREMQVEARSSTTYHAASTRVAMSYNCSAAFQNAPHRSTYIHARLRDGAEVDGELEIDTEVTDDGAEEDVSRHCHLR